MIVKPILGAAKFLVIGMVATGLTVLEALGLVLVQYLGSNIDSERGNESHLLMTLDRFIILL